MCRQRVKFTIYRVKLPQSISGLSDFTNNHIVLVLSDDCKKPARRFNKQLVHFSEKPETIYFFSLTIWSIYFIIKFVLITKPIFTRKRIEKCIIKNRHSNLFSIRKYKVKKPYSMQKMDILQVFKIPRFLCCSISNCHSDSSLQKFH